MITTQILSAGEIIEFAQRARSDDRWSGTIPVTSRLANLYATNPDGRESSPCMVVAFEDGRCIGYLGLLEQRLLRKDEERRLLAFSTFFVEPAYRGAGVAAKLLDTARTTGLPLITVGNSRAAERFFMKNGLVSLRPYKMWICKPGVGPLVARLANRLRRFVHARRFSAPGRLIMSMPEIARFADGRHLAVVNDLDRRLASAIHHRSEEGVSGRELPCSDDADMWSFAWTPAKRRWLLSDRCRFDDAEGGRLVDYHFARRDAAFKRVALEFFDRDSNLAGAAHYNVSTWRDLRTVSVCWFAPADETVAADVVLGGLRIAKSCRAYQIRAGDELLKLLPSDVTQRFDAVERCSFIDDRRDVSELAGQYEERFGDGDYALY